MPIKRLRVQFGGLCMLVQRVRTEPQGLFVLMPAMAHDDGYHHCPYVHCAGEFVQGGRNAVKLIRGEVIRWRDLFGVAGSKQDYQGRVAEISKYIARDPIPVDDRWLAGAASDCLAARIELPLPAEEFWFPEDMAELDVPAPQTITGRDIAYLCGRVVVTIRPRIVVDELRVGGLTLVPNADGDLDVAFLHVRPKDLKPRKYKHRKGKVVEHAFAYYHLLQPGGEWCLGHKRGPEIRVNVDEPDGDNDGADTTPCEKGENDYHEIPYDSRQLKPEFIDPFNCTIGGGCPPGDDC